MNKKKLIFLSPFEAQSFIISPRAAKGKLLNNSLQNELKSRYPGDLSRVHIDYIHHQNDQGIAFIAEPEIVNRAKTERGILISGISLMLGAFKKSRERKTNLVLTAIATPLWFEAIAIKDSLIQEHIASGSDNPDDWLGALQSLSKTEVNPKLILILKEILPENPALQKIIAAFPEAHIINFEDALPLIKRRDHELFKPKQKEITTPRLIILCLFIQSLAVLGSLLIIERKAERHLAHLTAAYEEQKANSLLFEEINNHKDTSINRGALTTIMEICRLAPDAWIRRLVIGDDRFDIEFDGIDSCETADRMNGSSLFSEVTLHEARPSALRGERFSLSGTIIHE